ncbi:Nif3-like dinuclear metal center hexameric protein [Lottiidibacillus patelloidae]|uniref:GTP cyclohydrolase 1 type 2 homolog n=1 Tax=Lottiidibacillus patelloidae TaxID=2670334 RepID=A0A263BX13_9BACI|nr:Nif3-like dinuclear metal center hexameric protein [Lottiidibacillus patelloidae]OZM57726.1 Nif3-like dinuclear metal center hexameric protein [Lottiidibacillus patelloidae]
MKKANGHTIIQAFERFSPKHLAEEGDPIGLQIGTLNKEIHKVMVTLDMVEDVIDEAVEKEVDLIIAHHPLIYRPLKKVTPANAQGRMVEKCIKNDIAVYAAHTNLDITNGGVNDLLAAELQLQQLEVLSPTYVERIKKLAVYVPKEDAEKVREALGNSGAGHIGDYSHCTFNLEGVGTFTPNEGSNPYIGETGKLESVNEVKVETVFPERLQKKVVSAMLKAHPYEEVAYDIYTLDIPGKEYGVGRIGYLSNEMTLKEFALFVKEKLAVDGVRVVGDYNKKIKKVAVSGGDGNKFISSALFKGADVFVTGDIYYHNAHDAMMEGLALVDPGHNVEKVMKKGVKKVLDAFIEEKKYTTEVIISEAKTDPFSFL